MQYESEQGIPYYVNNVTGVSQWDNPADEQYKEKIRIIKEKRNKQQKKQGIYVVQNVIRKLLSLIQMINIMRF